MILYPAIDLRGGQCVRLMQGDFDQTTVYSDHPLTMAEKWESQGARWLHMVDRGATTLWETWKESDNIYSNCHPMFGSVDEWILRFGK